MAEINPPPGPPPPNTDRATPGVQLYMWLAFGVGTVLITLRLYTRMYLKRFGGWDDFFIVWALVFVLGWNIGTAVQISHGYGRHIYYIPAMRFVVVLKLNVFVNICTPVTLFCSRTSIGIFLLRMTAPVRKWKLPITVGFAFNTIQALGTILIYSVQCVPVNRNWRTDVHGTCISRETFTNLSRAFGSLNVVTDFIFAFLPLFIIRGMNINHKIRLGIYLLLCCGLITAACSIGRVASLDLGAGDEPFRWVPISYWAISEMYGALILACMPAMHQLYLHLVRTDKWKSAKSHLHTTTTGAESSKFTRSRNNSDWADMLQLHKPASRKESAPKPTLPFPAVTKQTDIYVEHTRRSSRDQSFGMQQAETEGWWPLGEAGRGEAGRGEGRIESTS